MIGSRVQGHVWAIAVIWLFMGGPAAHADVAPEPVETIGLTVVVLAALALLALAVVISFRFLRRNAREAGKSVDPQ